MSQQTVIRLLPIQVFVLCVFAGWLAIQGVQALIHDGGTLPLLQAPAAAQPRVDVAAAPGVSLAPIFTPEVMHWQDKIVAWSQTYGLDPNLVATVMQIESCGAPNVVSSSGAQGLFQVMPFHFADGEDMQDPDTNAARGLAYLALGLQRSGGNAGLAFAGYNGGHGMIGQDSSLWPDQTKRYWYWATGIYEAALGGQASSARLQEWLNAGGASLCAKADEQIGLSQ